MEKLICADVIISANTSIPFLNWEKYSFLKSAHKFARIIWLKEYSCAKLVLNVFIYIKFSQNVLFTFCSKVFQFEKAM